MSSKIQEEERDHFSDRLKAALQAAGLDTSPTSFATAFNVRADGATVTVHGARKWLVEYSSRVAGVDAAVQRALMSIPR